MPSSPVPMTSGLAGPKNFTFAVTSLRSRLRSGLLSSLVLTGGPRSSQAAGAALVVPRRPHQEGPAAVCLISHPQHRPKGSEDPSLAAAGSLSGASNPHPVLNLTLLFLTKSISLLDVECAIANITTQYAGCGHPSTKLQRMATRSSPWNTQPFWVITARIL